MEVGPTLHYFMGGIRVDADSQSTRVPGLFACGECASGMHGANRLGGNSLSDLLVFGKLAGDGASAYVKEPKAAPPIDELQAESIIKSATDILNRVTGKNPFMVHEDLQDLMQKNVGIVRVKEELELALKELGQIKADAGIVKAHSTSQYNPGWNEAIDLKNLLVTAEAVTRAALMREESRGGHTRLDFEDESDEWVNTNIVIHQGEDGEMTVQKTRREAPSAELHQIANATLKELEKGK
jgi:succinate dehydrogenase / fumarate reductase flavoprotein subunit